MAFSLRRRRAAAQNSFSDFITQIGVVAIRIAVKGDYTGLYKLLGDRKPATERHVFTNVDGDESIKDVVCYETTSSHAQEVSQACPSHHE
jgi:hypothetical protein